MAVKVGLLLATLVLAFSAASSNDECWDNCFDDDLDFECDFSAGESIYRIEVSGVTLERLSSFVQGS